MAAYAAARGREGYACMGKALDKGMTHGVCVVVTSVARKKWIVVRHMQTRNSGREYRAR